MKTARTIYSFDGRAGCVEIRRSRKTRTRVGLYHSAQSGIESDPETPWTTVCEEHSSCVCHATLKSARDSMADPTMWCEPCREADEEKGAAP